MTRALFILIAICALVAVSMPARAQTPITDERANAYFTQCMSVDDARMSDSAQAELCACTSAKMMARMTAEELDEVGKPTETGKILMHRMQAEIYGPCMQAPVQELLFNECMRDKKILAFELRDLPRLCTCMAKRSAAYLEHNGTTMIQGILAASPDMTDPLPAIMNNQSLRQRANENIFSCLRENGTPQ